MKGDGDPKQHKVHVTVEDIGSYEVPAGSNLRETLRREGVFIDGTCTDKGTCGRCVVQVVDGDAGEPSLSETALLGGKSMDPGHRLACRVTVRGNLRVSIDPERMLEVDRTGRWKEVWGSPLWQPDLLQPDRGGYGIAVDLGTTTIGACLFDLSDARPLDIRSSTNPQMPWGEDIISRLGEASRDRETGTKLAALTWGAIKDLVRSLCLRNGVSGGRVGTVVVVGNSAMHHISLGLPVTELLTPPYRPAEKRSRVMQPGDLPVSMPVNRETVIYFPPLLGGYAGSDALASLLAAQSSGIKSGAVLDVGTNTEIAVWNGESVLIATAPSGPAFEGGHISCGMKADEGAIWKVHIDPEKVSWEVIGGGPPKGLCGTGMVDTIASMLRLGILDSSGLVAAGSHKMVKDSSFVLDDRNGVVLKGEDIATLQKAKSAVAATFDILLKTLGLIPDELEKIFLGGAFGSRLDIDSAVAAGLLPALPAHRYILAGNIALVGASMILVSSEQQERAEQLSRVAAHVDAAQDPDFEDLFIDNLYFPKP